jgi:hypothetical protein
MKTTLSLALLGLLFAACASDVGVPPTPTGDTTSELRPGEGYHESTNLAWLRCPVGMVWDGAGCAGVPAAISYDEAVIGCSEIGVDYRLPTLSELGLLLGSCSGEGEEARCRPCAESEECSAILAAQEVSEWTWTADETSGSAFVVEVARGRIAFESMSVTNVQARCVREL